MFEVASRELIDVYNHPIEQHCQIQTLNQEVIQSNANDQYPEKSMTSTIQRNKNNTHSDTSITPSNQAEWNCTSRANPSTKQGKMSRLLYLQRRPFLRQSAPNQRECSIETSSISITGQLPALTRAPLATCMNENTAQQRGGLAKGTVRTHATVTYHCLPHVLLKQARTQPK